MGDEDAAWIVFYLKSIRSAVISLTLVVLAFLFAYLGSDYIVLPLIFVSIVSLVYSLAPGPSDS